MEAIEKRSDGTMLVWAVGIAAVAVGVVGVAAFTDFTIRYRTFTLPQWTLYPVAVALFGGAGFTGYLAFGVTACARCKAPLVSREAYFELQYESQVAWAVTQLDPTFLEQLPPVPKNQMKSVVQVSYCEKCREVGTLQASKWQDFQPHDLTEERTVTGPLVERFAALAERHESFRGEDDDDE
ncbi:MAG: hypothetical protein RJA70_2022 [Pseudomonadota bacterium]|jgi:hypothetical protein